MDDIDARFKIIGPSGIIADIDVLDPLITGFVKNEIKDVKISPYFPYSPYLEPGVADHWGHACRGSMSFFVTNLDGTVEIISPIFFHDKSITHFGGLQHWNTEFWRYTQGETPQRVKKIPSTDIHQLVQTDWLEVIATASDFPTYRVRFQWDE